MNWFVMVMGKNKFRERKKKKDHIIIFLYTGREREYEFHKKNTHYMIIECSHAKNILLQPPTGII